MESLRCVVERITYQNEQNGYSVIKRLRLLLRAFFELFLRFQKLQFVQ